MNWEATGAVGEILGAAAVVVTLIYLSVQVRQNSLLAKASIRENRTDSSQKILLALADSAELVVKNRAGEPLDAVESARFELIILAMFRDYEAFAFQYEVGLLEDREWTPMKASLDYTMESGIVGELWEKHKFQFSEVLHRQIERDDA